MIPVHGSELEPQKGSKMETVEPKKKFTQSGLAEELGINQTQASVFLKVLLTLDGGLEKGWPVKVGNSPRSSYQYGVVDEEKLDQALAKIREVMVG